LEITMNGDENRFFGPAFGEDASVPAPVGQSCLWCEEAIDEGDSGVMIPVVDSLERMEGHWGAYHRECYLRSIVGSVAHQRRRCSCYGGDGEDDPSLTKREAAHAAAEEFDQTRMGQRLSLIQVDYINTTCGKCPDCMEGYLIQGPEGGASINCRCDRCGSEFNLARHLGQIIMGDRLEGGEDRDWCYTNQPKLAEWFGERV
jgi:hypothetical protein